MLLRDNYQSHQHTRGPQQFQLQLLTLLSQIVQRQDRGNHLLEKIVGQPSQTPVFKIASNFPTFNQLPTQPHHTPYYPQTNLRNQTSMQSKEVTGSFGRSEAYSQPVAFNVVPIRQENPLQRRIQNSKKKLARNANEIMSGLNRVLTTLESEPSMNATSYKIDVSRSNFPQTKRDMYPNRSESIISPTKLSKHFKTETRQRQSGEGSSLGNKEQVKGRGIFSDKQQFLQKLLRIPQIAISNQRYDGQMPSHFTESIVSLKSRPSQNSNRNRGASNQKHSPKLQSRSNTPPYPTINFTGENIRIENSRIQINIENDVSAIDHDPSENSKLLQNEALNTIIYGVIKGEESVMHDERQSKGKNRKKNSPAKKQIRFEEGDQSKKPKKEKNAKKNNNKKSQHSPTRKKQYREISSGEEQTPFPTNTLPIGYSPNNSDELFGPSSKQQIFGKSNHSDYEQEIKQKQFGHIDMPSQISRPPESMQMSRKSNSSKKIRRQTTLDSEFTRKESHNDPNIITDFEANLITIGTKKSPKGTEKSISNPRLSDEHLFSQTKKLNIPWQLIGKGFKMARKFEEDPADGQIVESMQYKYGNNFDNLKMYSRLNEVQPYSDKREMKVRVSFYEMFTAAGISEIKGQAQFETYIAEWLGITYRAIASIAWNLLQSHRLDFDQIKVLFTQNVIFNYVQLMKDIRQLGLSDFTHLVPEIVNKKSVNIIDFLCRQYPQTRAEAPNVALRSQIPFIDEKGRIEYELVRSSGVIFRYKKGTSDYSSEIMRFINHLIDISNDYYDGFEEKMGRLFNKIFMPQNARQQENQNQNNSNNAAYAEKVKKFTKFIIGRKIPKNAPKYTQEEIDNGIFFIKTSSVLRVISKWVEDLIEVIKKPDLMIRDWFHPFKNHEGNQQYAEYLIRKGIYNVILKYRKDLYERIQNIKRECYKIEGELSKEQHIWTNQHAHLSEQQMNVGLFASNLRNALSSYLCQQLNEVIHFLLYIPTKVDEKKVGVADYFEEKARKQLDSINLITFRIFDLLRCKCVSGETEIIWIIQQLQKMEKADKNAKEEQKFSIIRFKDRLNLGSRDVLINIKIGTGPVCEMQLSITNQVEQKQDMLDKYNHFLYELRRATMLGPLIQNVSIWTSLEQKSIYFDEVVAGKFKKTKVIPYVHKCSKIKMKKFVQPMICISCQVFFHIPRTCLMNWACVTCRSTICGECLYAGMNPQERKKQIFGRFFNKDLLGMLKEFDPKRESVPKKAFFLKKEELKAELCFMSSYVVKQKLEQEETTKAVQTVIHGDKIVNRALISTNQQVVKLYDYIIYQFDSHGRKMYLTIPEIQNLDMENDNKLRFLNLLQQPNYLESIKEVSNNKRKLRLLMDIQKIVRDKRIKVVKVKKTLVFIHVQLNYDVLESEIMRHQNFKRIRQFSESNSSVISIERKNMTTEIDSIRQELGKDRFFNLQKNITKVYLNYGLIQSIESLSFLANLQSLSISDNEVASLKGIERMVKLKILNFDQNKITSLEPIRNLVKLQHIMGNDNKLTSMKQVEKLRKLKQISFHANHLTKIEGVEKLLELQVLFIKNNDIEALQPLDCPKRLEQLTLSGNKITDFKNLVCMATLKQLSLSELKLKEIPIEVTKLASLNDLDLSNNEIESIPDLTKLTNLKKLKLKNNCITQIQGLQNLKLTYLNLDNNKISVLTGLANFFDTIEQISLRKNPIQEIGDFKDLQIEFKIHWDKNDFKPKARFEMENAFKHTASPQAMTNMMRLRTSTTPLNESMDISVRLQQ